MSENYWKTPRLFTPENLKSGETISLDKNQSHYLRTVLRKKTGEKIRVFNGKHGEYIASLQTDNKNAFLEIGDQIRPQPTAKKRTCLIFAPLKKKRMDTILEKCTELGITDYYPVITQRTEVRKINTNRIESQLTEASEQSERLDIPTLHKIQNLQTLINQWTSNPILSCIERADLPDITIPKSQNDTAFLIGPVGGFTPEEMEFLQNHKNCKPVSLGAEILRAETAAIFCACIAKIS